MLSLLKFLDGPWERARGYLREDLDTIESTINQRWNSVFDAANQVRSISLSTSTAAEATKLATARGINTVLFDGTADIIVPALPVVNAAQYGVFASGTAAANTTALNALLANTSLCPVAGVVVYIPPGVYNFNGNITITHQNVSLMGAGRETTRLNFSSGGLVYSINEINIQPIVISDLSITTSTTATATAIHISGLPGNNTPGVSQLIISRVTIRSNGEGYTGTGYFLIGIFVEYMASIHIVDVDITTIAAFQASSTVGIRLTNRVVGIYVDHCNFIYLNKAIWGDKSCESLQMRHCAAVGTNWGAYLDGPTLTDLTTYGFSDGMQITQNDFACCKGCIYAVHTSQGNFSDNYVQNFPGDGNPAHDVAFSGIELNDSSLTNRIANNVFVKGYANSLATIGIRLAGNSNTVIGNVAQGFNGVPDIAVWVETGGFNMVVATNPYDCTVNVLDAATSTQLGMNYAGLTTVPNGQMKFPAAQNASSNVNTLDDYEEGTWTPADGSGAALTLTSVSGGYQKIGRKITITCQFTYPVTASGAAAVISGLPFAVSGNGGLYACYQGGGVATTWYVPASGTTITPIAPITTTPITNAQMASGIYVLTGVYFTAN